MRITDINNIFSLYERITLKRGFIRALDNRRSLKFAPDKTLLNGTSKKLDLKNLKDIPEGKISFDKDDAHFECFFYKGNRKKLYVILDGARTSSGGRKKDIPIYNRWSWYVFSDCYWLSIEDPMYYTFPDLTVGWFYGTEEKNYRKITSDVVSIIAEVLGINRDNVIFYGGSAGGTAAIHTASLFGGGIAVSINGQLNFEYSHKDIDAFKANTGIDLHDADKWDRNDLCSIISSSSYCKFILIENCRSRWDYNDHLLYVCSRLRITPEYGISEFGNLTTWIYEAFGKKPHTSFEDKNLFFAVDFLTELIASGENLDRYKPLYQLFNEFWHDKYQIEVENNNQLNNLINDSNIILINADIISSKNMENVVDIENLILDAKEDKYFHYAYDELVSNSVYLLELYGVDIAPQSEFLTVGIYDSERHTLYAKVRLNVSECVRYAFVIRQAHAHLSLCVFVGEHGDTHGRRMDVADMKIYRCKADNNYL